MTRILLKKYHSASSRTKLAVGAKFCGRLPEPQRALPELLSRNLIFRVSPEYAGNLGDAGSDEWRQQEQQHILQLVDKF